MEPLINRRTFLQGLAGIAGLGGLASLGLMPSPVQQKTASIPPGRLLGPSAGLGHQLRDHRHFPQPSQTSTADIVIVGGGIAGLSALWWLEKQLQKSGQHKQMILLELENEPGGNSRSGHNAISGYPWGAHYVPIPGQDAHYVRQLLEELGIIKGYDTQDLPIYEELYLCHEPDERLFNDGHWQDGLVPTRGTNSQDKAEFKHFFEIIQTYKRTLGSDGKRAFTIPLELSSQDSGLLALDRISMQTWFQQQGFQSLALRWYLNYACRDDYGAPMDQISAWAGLHYFAGRDAKASNAEPQTVLTWPEGNGWLVNRLRKKLQSPIYSQAMVYNIEQLRITENNDDKRSSSESVQIQYWDNNAQQSYQINAQQVICATPHFVAQRLIPSLANKNTEPVDQPDYSPWLVANISVRQLPQSHEDDFPIAWDNVGYRDSSLGYVVATHQDINQFPGKSVLTYYRPLDNLPPRQARHEAYQKTYADWATLILADLKTMHPEIDQLIETIHVWIWGHGMIRPNINYIWGANRQKRLTAHGKIHFAHSDMSGISIFEEAQYRGVIAAEAVLDQIHISNKQTP